MTGGRAPFLYVVVCAAGVAEGVGTLIGAAQREGWQVGVVATPPALAFIDPQAVQELTGHPVRSAWRRPGDPRPLPPADAVALAPATFNTVNKWAAGISDTLALGILCEAPGLGTPVAVQPCLNTAQAAHPAYRANLDTLRSMGVLIGTQPPVTGKETAGRTFDWTEPLTLLRPVLDARRDV
ncbi:flavoprotein [Kitasatospora sp. NPDC048540]|uniref:flavoprotein n=1 Tax=unclassified Kitasatospora TaxID=2633591 RepID=UPI00053ADEE4|nr:flavoprotein [Kitasatospora sp. MBT63]